MHQNGIFVISLDFEMYWGVHDVLQYEAYKENLDNVRAVINRTLEAFSKYEIHATWATVGFLFLNDGNELMTSMPTILPEYTDSVLSPYPKLDSLLSKEINHVLFAPDLIDRIKSIPFQEVGTHTFSHYYCMEEGQNIEHFIADLDAAKKVALKKGIHLESIVFPRNQSNLEYLTACKDLGITTYRGNEKGFAYKAISYKSLTSFTRIFRLLDSYINLSGYHTYKLSKQAAAPLNLPSSRFLRPFSAKLKVLDSLKLKRIKDAMTHAAKNKEVFHLWWHPHNFGKDLQENFYFLDQILEHYSYLNKTYNFSSLTMGEVAKLTLNYES